MSDELIYTSVPHGLRTGSKGYCTVAATPGLSRGLTELLESLSGYRHLGQPGDSSNPVNYAHYRVAVRGANRLSILSRVADAGLDYSGRSNKLAHHIALSADELTSSGPAACISSGVHRKAWSGEPGRIPQRNVLPVGRPAAGVCTAWAAATGDAGWAGVVVEHVLTSQKPGYIIFPIGCDVLPLLLEVERLLPAPWMFTFSAYFTRVPPDVTCQWRCVPAGSDEARSAMRRGVVIDLCQPSAPPESRYVQAARDGRIVNTTITPPRKQQSTKPKRSTPPTRPGKGSSVDILEVEPPASPGPSLAPTPPEPPTQVAAPRGRANSSPPPVAPSAESPETAPLAGGVPMWAFVTVSAVALALLLIVSLSFLRTPTPIEVASKSNAVDQAEQIALDAGGEEDGNTQTLSSSDESPPELNASPSTSKAEESRADAAEHLDEQQSKTTSATRNNGTVERTDPFDEIDKQIANAKSDHEDAKQELRNELSSSPANAEELKLIAKTLATTYLSINGPSLNCHQPNELLEAISETLVTVDNAIRELDPTHVATVIGELKRDSIRLIGGNLQYKGTIYNLSVGDSSGSGQIKLILQKDKPSPVFLNADESCIELKVNGPDIDGFQRGVLLTFADERKLVRAPLAPPIQAPTTFGCIKLGIPPCKIALDIPWYESAESDNQKHPYLAIRNATVNGKLIDEKAVPISADRATFFENVKLEATAEWPTSPFVLQAKLIKVDPDAVYLECELQVESKNGPIPWRTFKDELLDTDRLIDAEDRLDELQNGSNNPSIRHLKTALTDSGAPAQLLIDLRSAQDAQVDENIETLNPHLEERVREFLDDKWTLIKSDKETLRKLKDEDLPNNAHFSFELVRVFHHKGAAYPVPLLIVGDP